MTYYKVKPEFDQMPIRSSNGVKYYGFLIANELLTPYDIKRYFGGNVPYKAIELVNIKKSRVYWCFGTRFAME